MGIRPKLFLIIAIMIASFVVCVVVYFALVAPLAKISAEEASLFALRRAFLQEELAAEKLATTPFQDGVAKLTAANRVTTDAFLKVQGLKVLRSLSASIGESLDTIQALKVLVDQNMTSLMNETRKVVEVSNTLSGANAGTATLFELFHDATAAEGKGRNVGSVGVTQVYEWLNRLNVFSSGLQEGIAVVDSQSATITSAVNAIGNRSKLLSLGVIAVLLLLTALLALFLSNRLVRSIQLIDREIFLMKEGDLTRVFSAKTRDEIGTLSGNLNEFLASLRASVDSIQATSNENVRMKESLIVTTEQTGGSARQVRTNANSINSRISSLDENLVSATAAIEGIGQSIRSLDGEIHQQLAMVEESTASVTEMITSIDNVANIADRRQDAADRLVQTVTEGGERISEAFETINLINASVESIKGITGIIENISSETNLLAMNAAIEAAHAGEAGKGFSVVADEIRKLAMATSANSQEISKILKEIVERVVAANTSGSTMNAAFALIDHEVNALHESLVEIFSTMKEIRLGGGQILQAMTSLQEISTKVRSGSSSIDDNANRVRSTMTVVQQVSSEVRSGMGEISAGMGEIASSVEKVLVTAQRLGELSESLDRGIARFKTG